MITPQRYIPNDGKVRSVPDYEAELLASLERINTYNPPVHTCSTGWGFAGFYTGPTSIAYLFFALSRHYPELLFKQQSLVEWAESYLHLGEHEPHKAPDPSHCGIANESLARLALTSVINSDTSLVKKLCSFQSVINDPEVDGSNEWLYGRAGYLYFLRLCQACHPGADIAPLLNKTINQTIERILSVARPWMWQGKQYLGAAHGTIGIICQIVLSSQARSTQLEQLLGDVLATQFASGNFPSSHPSNRDDLVQFCHGSPGFVVSLRSISGHFPSLKETIDRVINVAVENVWQKGLLVKFPGLCHGIAGNSLVFDVVDKSDRARFDHFLNHMQTSMLEENPLFWMRDAGKSDSFAGLYTGEAGRAWVWAVAHKDLPRTCLGYNDV